MPGTGSTAARNVSRRLKRKLARIIPSDTPCGVPGCGAGRAIEDCCRLHSYVSRGSPADEVPNDGIIDWLAIDIAVRGLRRVRLTWVEKDIAVGMMLANGEGITAAQERIGVRVTGVPTGRRVLAAQKIAEALVAREADELRLTPREVEQIERALDA